MVEYNYFFKYLNIFESFNFRFENIANIYVKRYNKIQDIAGAISWIFQIFSFISEILNYFLYHSYKIIEDFNSEIYKIYFLKKIRKIILFLNKGNNFPIINFNNDSIRNANGSKI